VTAKAYDYPSPPVGEGGSAVALPGEGSEAIATPHPSRRKGGSPPSPSRGEGNFLKRRARSMRREPTEAEKKLWYALRNRRFGKRKFRRQVPVGRYIVDFLCCEKWLIIEVDGGQHNERDSDLTRDAWLRSQGYMTLRYWNTDVLENLAGVLMDIESRGERARHPSPPVGEGGSAVALPGEGCAAGENTNA
jgi:very-short-patch-repair endonuclease